jgi:uncharacterized protein YkwD
MSDLRRGFALVVTGVALAIAGASPQLLGVEPQSRQNQAGESDTRTAVEQLFVLANQARAAQGLPALQWDPSLAQAALRHCQRMTVEGPISHRYNGELDLTERAAQAGAHFSLIEENIAVGAYPASIHQGWMNSPGHRANLLSRDIDHVGIAVVPAQGVLFAVTDFSKSVETLTQAQVEAKVAAMLQRYGLAIASDPREARTYCASNGHFNGPDAPHFLMRWQNPDLTVLPDDLVKKASSGDYRRAAVGSCEPQGLEGTFTAYRLAVLLY